MNKAFTFWLALSSLVLGVSGTPVWGASAPAITGFPVVNASTLVADDATPYTVTTTFTDADGSDSIRCIRVLFNYTEAGGDQADGRGYMNWGKTDADVTQWGGNWVIADATGGGRWAYRTDAWGGITYITPLSCETTVSGKATGGSGSRTVTWAFTVKPAWAFNPVMNDADAWAADGVIGAWNSYVVGWIDGQARRLDDDYYLLGFTPRRRRSPWSRSNVERVAVLAELGLIRPPGQAEIDRAKADGRWAAALEK